MLSLSVLHEKSPVLMPSEFVNIFMFEEFMKYPKLRLSRSSSQCLSNVVEISFGCRFLLMKHYTACERLLSWLHVLEWYIWQPLCHFVLICLLMLQVTDIPILVPWPFAQTFLTITIVFIWSGFKITKKFFEKRKRFQNLVLSNLIYEVPWQIVQQIHFIHSFQIHSFIQYLDELVWFIWRSW